MDAIIFFSAILYSGRCICLTWHFYFSAFTPPSCYVAPSFETRANVVELLRTDNAESSRTFPLTRRPPSHSLGSAAFANNITTRFPFWRGKTPSSSTSTSSFFGPRAFKLQYFNTNSTPSSSSRIDQQQ